MRIKITLSTDKQGNIDFNYQHQIQAIIYEFLARSDPDYAEWLHSQGFVYKNDKRFKLFVYSGITFDSPFKTVNFNGLSGFYFSSPFSFSFQIASPVNQFLQHLIEGIFKKGTEVKLGRQKLNVYRIETLPELKINKNSEYMNLKPLESPIFIKKPMPSGERDIYLFPDDSEYEDFLNQNLMNKYETLYGKPYEGKSLRFDFKFEQYERFTSKKIKSFKIFKNGQVTGEIKGTLQPFKVTGAEELIRIGLECGFGQNNSMGCGYVEELDRKK